jgi:RecB family exonuclease
MKHKDDGNKYSKFGNAFHSVAEAFPVADDIEGMKAKYLREFNAIPVEMFADSHERQEFFNKGVNAMRNFGQTYKDADVPVSVEEEFKVRIAEDLPPAKGFIDRIDGEEGKPETYIITDYKTSNTVWPKSKLRDEFQLGLYALMAHAKYGEWPAAVKYYFPIPNKFVTAVKVGPGKYRYQNQRKPVLEINCAEVIVTIREIIEQIKVGNFEKNTADTFFCEKFCAQYKMETCDGPTGGTQLKGWGDI